MWVSPASSFSYRIATQTSIPTAEQHMILTFGRIISKRAFYVFANNARLRIGAPRSKRRFFFCQSLRFAPRSLRFFASVRYYIWNILEMQLSADLFLLNHLHACLHATSKNPFRFSNPWRREQSCWTAQDWSLQGCSSGNSCGS